MIALDKSSPKVTKLQENIRRFNLSCVQCFKFDATKALLATSTGEVDGGLYYKLVLIVAGFILLFTLNSAFVLVIV